MEDNYRDEKEPEEDDLHKDTEFHDRLAFTGCRGFGEHCGAYNGVIMRSVDCCVTHSYL